MRVSTAALLVLAWTARAGAHGNEFPDSLQLFLPEAQPDRILLATNFGLVVSDDGGATFHVVCEEAFLPFAWRYHVTRDGEIHAASPAGMTSSRDLCTWTPAGGALTGAAVYEVTSDPTLPSRVLTVALPPQDGGTIIVSLWESLDGARRFDAPLYRPLQFLNLTNAAVAPSAPDTVYAAMYHSVIQPFVARSIDRGRNFEMLDLEPSLGKKTVQLVEVDAANPRRLLLRAKDADGESLAVSDDGGASARVTLTVPGVIGGIVHRADGSIVVGARDGAAFRSLDGGERFAGAGFSLRLRALGERGGRLYAAADGLRDDFALGVSDDGVSFAPVLRFLDIRGPLPCVEAICAAPWAMVRATLLGVGDGGAPGDGGTGGGGGDCGCAVGRSPVEPAAWWALVALLFARLLRRFCSRVR